MDSKEREIEREKVDPRMVCYDPFLHEVLHNLLSTSLNDGSDQDASAYPGIGQVQNPQSKLDKEEKFAMGSVKEFVYHTLRFMQKNLSGMIPLRKT